MSFSADFEIIGDPAYSNEKIEFNSISTTGLVVNTDDLEVEGNVTKEQVFADGASYVVSVITKTTWSTSDGYFFSGDKLVYNFDDSGIANVEISVYSQYFELAGEKFRFKVSANKDITVFSKFYKMIIDRFPMWEQVQSPAQKDLFYAASQFFERIYKDIKETLNNIDMEVISPDLFEYMSLTFGHDQNYAKKVGSDVNNEEFESYDIYEKIRVNKATPAEIKAFRQFLLFSSTLFKGKGTPNGLKMFLSLFTIDAKIIELWTEYWGLKTKGITDETFAALATFADNTLGLRWLDVRVVGNNNDVGQFSNNFNSFTIDNYHQAEKVEYDADVVSVVSSGGPKLGWYEFELSGLEENFIDILRENGDQLADPESHVIPELYDIVPNEPVRHDPTKKYVLQLSPDIVDHGDRFSLNFTNAIEDEVDSLVASTKEKILNLDLSIKYKIHDISIEEKNNNYRLPEDEIFVALRGIPQDNDLSANFNEYYRVSINARRSTFSIEKVVENNVKKLITQKINLSGDKNNLVFDKLILDEVTNEPYIFLKDYIYEFKVSINGDNVSAYFRKSVIDEEIETKIASDVGDIPFGQEETTPFVTLVENVSINVDDASVVSTDQNGEEVISYPYVAITTPGYFGIGCRNTIFEVREVTLDNLDFDESLYSTEEKEISLKPLYLEWLNDKLIKYNSYPNNVQSFTKPIENPFNKNTKQYSITEQEKDALEFFYFDNANVTEDIGSRYTVIFDKDWVKENFESETDVMNKIVVPFGSQTSWFLPESRIQNRNAYKNYYGNNDTIWTESTPTTSTPSTSDPTTVTASGYIPGFFNYDLLTTYDKYKTEPLDDFSSMDRNDDGFGNILYLNERISQYKLSNNPFYLKGVYEEVSPFSTYFEELDGVKKLSDGSNYKNKVFLPIVFKTATYRRLLGVRFKHCDDISTIISRATFEFQNEIQLYGAFDLHFPGESVKFRPDREIPLRPSPFRANYFIGRVYVPLGVLNPNIQNYSLGAEFMHFVDNSGATDIWMDGVYFRIPKNKTIYRDSLNEVELDSANPFENREKGLSCRHYLSAEINLGTKLEDYERTLLEDDISNKYLISSNIRKFLKKLEDTDTYNYDTDYLWWLPDQLFRKRDFIVAEMDVEKDIATGINFTPGKIDKAFYGHVFDAQTDDPRFLQFKITDGKINKNTYYYAKIVVRMNYSGFNQGNLNRDQDAVQKENRPLSGTEADNVKVLGGIKQKYDNNILAPVKECLDFYVPIAWYPEGDIPKNNIIEWANYLRGSYGTSTSPTLTMTPYGLMTWLIQYSGEPNAAELATNFAQVTSGWTLKDWNDRFRDLVKIESIVEKVPTDKYKLYDEFGFVSKYAPNNGSYVEVKYDIGDLPWKVEDTANLIPKEISSYYFTIPRDVQSLRDWVFKVESLKLYNYILPQSFYEFLSPTAFKLNNDVLFDIFDGSIFNGRYFFDIFFDSNEFELLADDFDTTRNISWTVYENTMEDKFELATRKPSENIVFESEDETYEIVSVDGSKAFKRLDNKTISKFDPRKSGSNAAKNNTNIAIDDNGGFSQTVYIIDSKNEVFDLEADVFFDEALNDFTDYNGKRFEFVVKSNSTYNPLTKKYNLSEYYFVGVGTYGFDISLGVAKYDFTTNKVNKSFLAGFGQYNTRNIRTNVWYRLKVSVNNQYIKVMFNERNDRPRQVLTYCIDPSRQTDPNKYLKGEFEELVYLVSGLDNLDITYPEKLAEKSNQVFFDTNWNEALARDVRPVGPFSGFRIFNDMTYVTNLVYRAKIEDDRTYGENHDVTDYTNVITRIKTVFGVTDDVTYVGKTLSGTIVVMLGNNLFYQHGTNDPVLYSSTVDKVRVFKSIIIIKYMDSSTIQMVIVDEYFKTERNVYVKDSGFNSDHIYKYLLYTQRGILDIFVTDKFLHVVMQNIQE
jgi:hypothetical protein